MRGMCVHIYVCVADVFVVAPVGDCTSSEGNAYRISVDERLDKLNLGTL